MTEKAAVTTGLIGSPCGTPCSLQATKLVALHFRSYSNEMLESSSPCLVRTVPGLHDAIFDRNACLTIGRMIGPCGTPFNLQAINQNLSQNVLYCP